MQDLYQTYDYIIIGGGVSGPIIAKDLVQTGAKCLMLEAGPFYLSHNFPRKEIDTNSQMYWNGGAEFSDDSELAILRPKVVGGGSIINGGLLDRFDQMAFDDFKTDSGSDIFQLDKLTPYYDQIEQDISIQKIPEKFANKNGQFFKKGFQSLGLKCSPLDRGQKDCPYSEGMNCIECLGGCRNNSKQSTMTTYLRDALKSGLQVFSQFEVDHIIPSEENKIIGRDRYNKTYILKAKNIVLAAGSIGNSKLLLRSGLNKFLPGIGKNFFGHPQYMLLGVFDEQVNAYEGPLQSYKSDDPKLRNEGFKLENVFAPPVAISMLFHHFGQKHTKQMLKYDQLACIEVAIRDTNPGDISLDKNMRIKINKRLNSEDKKRKKQGFEKIKSIFQHLNAKEVIEGNTGISLHLMGGCALGVDSNRHVVTPDFHLHGFKNIYCADSSIFPNAPGINPSLTVMALSKLAAQKIVEAS